MKRAFVIFIAGTLLPCAIAFATTYVRVEKDGTKTYSDRPMPGGHPIEIEAAQTYDAPETQPNLTREQKLVAATEDFRYESCTIVPRNDETLPNPELVNVVVSTSPMLRVGDIVTLLVDGQRVGGDRTLSHTISPVFRGAHTVTVRINNKLGTPLCQATSTFYVLKPSLNAPQRR